MTAATARNDAASTLTSMHPSIWIAPAGIAGLAFLAAEGPRALSVLQLVIAGITIFVGAIVAAFSRRFMRSDPQRTSYFARIAMLIGSVLFLVLTSDLLVFAAAWVASGILLASLVGHANALSEAREAAIRARRTFLIGDLALLAALAIVGGHGGTTDISSALSRSGSLSPLAGHLAALLLVIAAAARCALPPFSAWLLSSMTAPTPVSALMHAGLVNAGGFLLLRLAPVLEAAPVARYAAVGLGLFAALWGLGIMAVRPDAKRALAGSTVSQMGFMIMSCGLGAYAAALWHIAAHGLFKAWLFLGAGSLIGMRERERVPISRSAVLMAALVALLAGAYLAFTAKVGGELVALTLAVAAGAATLIAGYGAPASRRARARLVGLVAALIAANAAGLLLIASLYEAHAEPLLPSPLLFALAALFLVAWLLQAARKARGAALPPALYVRLLNAGALPAPRTGDLA